MKIYKILSKTTLLQNPWWEYRHDRVLMSNGQEKDCQEKDFHYGVVKNGSVIIVPILDDGRLILIRQYRYIHNNFCVEFPSGGIHSKESTIDAAKRELLEETRCKTNNIDEFGLFENTAGLIKNKLHLFIAKKLHHTKSNIRQDPTEKTKVLILSIDEIEEMIKKGEIWEGKTLATWAIIMSKKLL